jgi:hypothetical protein
MQVEAWTGPSLSPWPSGAGRSWKGLRKVVVPTHLILDVASVKGPNTGFETTEWNFDTQSMQLTEAHVVIQVFKHRTEIRNNHLVRF